MVMLVLEAGAAWPVPGPRVEDLFLRLKVFGPVATGLE